MRGRMLTVLMTIISTGTLIVPQPFEVNAAGATDDVVTVTPTRIVDTRPGLGIDDAGPVIKGIRASGQITRVKVTGRGGVPADASAVLVNLTVPNPETEGFITAYACDTPTPLASSLNLNPTLTETNLILTKVGKTGEICVFSRGRTHLVIDLDGYLPTGRGVRAMAPRRLVDTRAGFGIDDNGPDPKGVQTTGDVMRIKVAGRAGVPADATGVILNLTVPNPLSEGHLRVYACGYRRPDTSSINLNPGKTDATSAWAKVGTDGEVCIYTVGRTDVIVDLYGYVASGSDVVTVGPSRALDTRKLNGPVADQSITKVKIAGTNGVPTDATAALLNVTSPNPPTEGFVTAFACDMARPATSNLNLNPGRTEANAVVTRLDDDGYVCLYSWGRTDLIVDVDGYMNHTVPTPEPVKLQVLAFNDYHGHVTPDGNGKVDGVAAGGAEFLAAKLELLRKDAGNTVTVAAGDLIGGSPFFSGLFHDEPSIESLNAMGLDVSSVGNHEFDEGVTELIRMQYGGCHPVDGCYFPAEPYKGADFDYLAANVVRSASDTTVLPPYWIKEYEGVKVGFIGMTLEATDTLVAASGIRGYEFRDEAETANALVPKLQAQGVETIIVLLHEGGIPVPITVNGCSNISGPIIAINNTLDPAIDAMVTGHTHLPYVCQMNDSAGQPRLVTSAYSYGRLVTEMNLVIDPTTGDVIRDQSSAVNHVVTQDVARDPAQTDIIEKWLPLVEQTGNKPVGRITANIDRGGDPPGTDRGVESAAGNLVADAQLWATSAFEADIALMNPGGVRTDLQYSSPVDVEGPGVVTFGEASDFQPFNNTLYTIPMTGAQLKQVLEEQCQPVGSARPFLHLGVSEGFTYDLAKTIELVDNNMTCTSVTVTNMSLNGTAIDPAATYKITVNNFLFEGGDNFTTFKEIDPATREDGGSDLQAFVNYLDTYSPVAPPPTDRVTVVN